jgi:hypothetical protein
MVGGGSSSASPTTARYEIVEVGRVLGPSDVGVPPGETSGTADVSAIALPDGRVRVYFGRFGTAPLDGLTFDSETDTGLVGTEPSLVRLGDGSLFSTTASIRPAPDRQSTSRRFTSTVC